MFGLFIQDWFSWKNNNKKTTKQKNSENFYFSSCLIYRHWPLCRLSLSRLCWCVRATVTSGLVSSLTIQLMHRIITKLDTCIPTFYLSLCFVTGVTWWLVSHYSQASAVWVWPFPYTHKTIGFQKLCDYDIKSSPNGVTSTQPTEISDILVVTEWWKEHFF